MKDRFATIDTSGPHCDTSDPQYCGGTWQGIVKKLDYMQSIGFDVVWISPVVVNVEWNTSYGEAYHMPVVHVVVNHLVLQLTPRTTPSRLPNTAGSGHEAAVRGRQHRGRRRRADAEYLDTDFRRRLRRGWDADRYGETRAEGLLARVRKVY